MHCQQLPRQLQDQPIKCWPPLPLGGIANAAHMLLNTVTNLGLKPLVLVFLALLVLNAQAARANDETNSSDGQSRYQSAVVSNSLIQHKRLSWEFGLGMGFSRPFIDLSDNETNSAVTNRATNLNLRFGGAFEVSPSLHLTTSMDWSLGKDLRPFGHESVALLFAVGGVLGNLDQPGSFFISGSLGPGFIDVSAEEIETFGATLSQGAMGRGIGYRISAGRTLSRDARWEVTYLRINDSAVNDGFNDLVDIHAGSLNLVVSTR